MKRIITALLLAIIAATGTAYGAQERQPEYLGLPGDNLNLYAVMNLFQESETLEQFERDLNSKDSRINNLDLNRDGLVDYITVTDYPDGQVHNIVLRVALDDRENQDVAVFTVERYDNGSVAIQLIGDEDLYGRNYIIEPIYDDQYGETPNPGYTGRTQGSQRIEVVRTTYVEVAAWPLIRFIFTPGYITWRSAWYWGYWPAYWHAWRPYYWDYYYGFHSHWYPHYYSHFRLWHHPRVIHYHNHYYSHIRVHSPRVRNDISEGRYRSTYSRPELRERGRADYARLQSGERNNRQEGAISRNRSNQQGSDRIRGASASGQRSAAAVSARDRSVSASGRISNREASGALNRDRSAVTGNRGASGNINPSAGRTDRSSVSRSSAPAQTKSASRPTTVRSGASNSRSAAVQSRSDSRTSVSRSSAPAQTKSASRPSTVRSGASNSRSAAVQSRSDSRTSVSRSSAPAQTKSASRGAGVSSSSSSRSSWSSPSAGRSSSGQGRVSASHSSPSRSGGAVSSSRSGGSSSGGGGRNNSSGRR